MDNRLLIILRKIQNRIPKSKRIKKLKFLITLVIQAYALRYGTLYRPKTFTIESPIVNVNQKIPDEQTAIENEFVDINDLEFLVEIRGGDDRYLKFTGPYARARADANRIRPGNFNLIPGVQGFAPQQNYYNMHQLQRHLSGRQFAQLVDRRFPGNGAPPGPGNNLDPSDYKGGPSPFERFNYDNPSHRRNNIDMSSNKRMSHSFDKHAKKCFGIEENRNNLSLEKFRQAIRDYVESRETQQINGSYRYEIPAYHYRNPDTDLIVTVNATNNEYVSVRNATRLQLTNFNRDGNLGYDNRPILLRSGDPTY